MSHPNGHEMDTSESHQSIPFQYSSRFEFQLRTRPYSSQDRQRQEKTDTTLVCTGLTVQRTFRSGKDKTAGVRRELQVHRDRAVANDSSWAGLACSQKHKCGVALLHLVRTLVTGRFSGTICETVWWVEQAGIDKKSHHVGCRRRDPQGSKGRGLERTDRN